jgi:hypothetical protein
MKNYVSWMMGASLVLSAGVTGAFSFKPGEIGTPAAPVSRSANPTPSNEQIRIVSPRDHAIVPIGQNKVEISTENIALDAAHPWHLYLDGNLVGTIENGETTFTFPISVSGPHEIKATLSDTKNDDLASASVQVTAAPETPSSSPFNLPWVAPAMGVLLIGVVALTVIGLRITWRKDEA